MIFILIVLILYNIILGKHETPSLTVKETEKSDLSETDLPFGNEVESSEKHEFQCEKVCVYIYSCAKLLL